LSIWFFFGEFNAQSKSPLVLHKYFHAGFAFQQEIFKSSSVYLDRPKVV